MIQPSTPIWVRQAQWDDLDTIVAFNTALARETEQRDLDVVKLREGVRTLLASPGHGFYVVAEQRRSDGAQVVGQLMITYEWSDWRNGIFWWVQSVYIPPHYRRQGIFRALHDHIQKRATADPTVCGIRLYVERDNHQAQTVYRRVGLTPSGYTVFEQDFVLTARI